MSKSIKMDWIPHTEQPEPDFLYGITVTCFFIRTYLKLIPYWMEQSTQEKIAQVKIVYFTRVIYFFVFLLQCNLQIIFFSLKMNQIGLSRIFQGIKSGWNKNFSFYLQLKLKHKNPNNCCQINHSYLKQLFLMQELKIDLFSSIL